MHFSLTHTVSTPFSHTQKRLPPPLLHLTPPHKIPLYISCSPPRPQAPPLFPSQKTLLPPFLYFFTLQHIIHLPVLFSHTHTHYPSSSLTYSLPPFFIPSIQTPLHLFSTHIKPLPLTCLPPYKAYISSPLTHSIYLFSPHRHSLPPLLSPPTASTSFPVPHRFHISLPSHTVSLPTLLSPP